MTLESTSHQGDLDIKISQNIIDRFKKEFLSRLKDTNDIVFLHTVVDTLATLYSIPDALSENASIILDENKVKTFEVIKNSDLGELAEIADHYIQAIYLSKYREMCDKGLDIVDLEIMITASLMSFLEENQPLQS